MNPLRRSVYLLAVIFSFATLALAGDPPGRVARLQYVTGSVSVQPNGNDEWVEATMNRPMTNSDNLWTDKDSRAELNVGTGVMRMDAMSSLTITNVSDNTVQVSLHQGTLNLHVRHLWDGEIYEIDTPNMAFTVQKSGEYRFDVDPNGDASVVTVWKGEGDATGTGPSVRVRKGEQARFTNGTSLAHSMHDAPGFDGFDDWCRVRDERLDHSVSARYVQRDTIGYEDLDDNGVWREIPPYGPVWVPTVAAGWAPYHYGHWVWISPWGWTWVDDAPWGFAPFHYGRWVYYNNYWGWAPGPYYVRPVYAPALVAWFGGPGWGVSFGFGGGVGWCPLGFGEPFYPWYGHGRGYFRNVNITNTRIVNITNITNNYYNVHGRGHGGVPQMHYANMRAPGGVVAVNRDVLVHSRPVGREAFNIPANRLHNVRAVDRVPVQPTRASSLGIHGDRPMSAPPARGVSRPVFSRMTPPAGNSRSGGPQIASIQRSGGAMQGRFNEGPANSPRAMNGHYVPRPPQAGGSPVGRSMNAAGSVPHPSQGGMRGAGSVNSPRGSGPTQSRPVDRMSGSSSSVPRPPAGGGGWERSGGTRGSQPRDVQSGPRGNSSNGPRSAVPRPNGPVRPASEDRMAGRGSYGGGYGRGGNSDAYGSGGSGRSGSRPEWNGPSRGGYSEPRMSSPSREGNGGYSAGRAGGGYGGGGYSAGRSGGGYSGGGARSAKGGYSGGGHASGGGGYSGGGHAGGGGGSGHSSGGGGQGGGGPRR
jgi:hypothetical protein